MEQPFEDREAYGGHHMKMEDCSDASTSQKMPKIARRLQLSEAKKRGGKIPLHVSEPLLQQP